MKTKTLNFFSRILSFFLVLLGFSSCDESPVNGGGGRLEYGTPSALFKVKGKTIVEKSLIPVKGIRVILSDKEPAYSYPDTTYTDSEGKFNTKMVGFPAERTFYLKFEDVDGTTNGVFETKTDSVRFSNPKFKNGSGNWYRGETEKDMGTVSLHQKNNE